MGFARFLTDLGDAFVASAVAAVMLVWIWKRLGWPIGLVFGVCFSGVWLSVLMLKLIARDWAPPPRFAGLWELSQGAPSGHTALAATVFGCAAVVFLALDRRLPGLLGAGASLCAMAIVAVTRVTLHMHTLGDVLAGLAVAAIGVALFGRALAMRRLSGRVRSGDLLLALFVAALLALASGVRASSAMFL